jgi:hypothetical protein
LLHIDHCHWQSAPIPQHAISCANYAQRNSERSCRSLVCDNKRHNSEPYSEDVTTSFDTRAQRRTPVSCTVGRHSLVGCSRRPDSKVDGVDYGRASGTLDASRRSHAHGVQSPVSYRPRPCAQRRTISLSSDCLRQGIFGSGRRQYLMASLARRFFCLNHVRDRIN